MKILFHFSAVVFFLFCLAQTGNTQCGAVVGDTVYVTNSTNVAGSLRAAINCVNDPGNSIRFIHFNISNPGVITITPTPAAPLPAITKADVVVDARTQPGWFLGKVVIDGSIAGNNHAIQTSADNLEVYGLYITGFTNAATGAAIALNSGSGAVVSENALSGNRFGILASSPSSFTATENLIGVHPTTSAAQGNAVDGIRILTSALGNFQISDNTIAHNTLGIFTASGAVNLLANNNRIFCNIGGGIERSGFTVAGFSITTTSTTTVAGTGPNGAVIEVFLHDPTGCDPVNPPCQGNTFIGSATVSGNAWSLNVSPGVLSGSDLVTATATTGGNNTSEFLSCSTVVCDGILSFSNVQDACGITDSGSATVAVTGGGAFNYLWSDGQTTATAVDLAPGNYTVVVSDAAGCVYTGAVTIGSLPEPTANPTANTPLCAGETLNLVANANGGTPGYTYAWSGPAGFSSVETDPDLNNVLPANSGTYSLTVTDINGCEDRADAAVVINPAPSFSLNGVDADCNGASTGSITLTTSAVPPLSFVWSNGAVTQNISNLAAGNYAVTLTDGNNCQATGNLDIGQPAVLELTLDSNDATCGLPNGSATASSTGGTPGYTYSWSNGVIGPDNMGLPPGNYSVTVTDTNSCTETENVSMGNIPGPTLTPTVTPVACNGDATGTISLTVNGGTPPIGFIWSNGALTQDIFNLPAGNYSVTATDANNCEAVQNATVIEPDALDVAINTTNSLCSQANGTAQAVVQGGATPYNFEWSTGASGSGITGLAAGIYGLTVTDANLCVFETTASIDDEGSPGLDVSVTNPACFGQSTGAIDVDITGGLPPFDFSWNNGATTQNIDNLSAGTYSLTVTDANVCQATLSVSVSDPTALLVNNFQPSRPSTVGGSDGVLVFNISGGTAPYSYSWAGPVSGSNTQLAPGSVTIGNLSAGNYALSVTDANNCSQSQTFSINDANCSLEITGANTTEESCAGNMDGSITLTLTGGQAPFNFNWTGGGNSGSGTGVVITNLAGGPYLITVTGQDGCVATTSADVGVTTVPPPNPATASECDPGSGQAVFDLTALENSLTPGPGYAVLWFLDAAGLAPINNPQAYNSGSGQVFAVLEQSGCRSMATAITLQVLPAGSPGCGGVCTTFAGTMALGPPAAFCASQNAVATYNNNAVLDANDILLFVLHTLPGTTLGDILGSGPTPSMAFDPGVMAPGTTYYLSAVAGNAAGGGIDLADPCLSVAPGQAVEFSADTGGVLNFIQGEEVLCQGEMLLLSTNDLGDTTAVYHWITPAGDTIDTNGPDFAIDAVQPSDAGEYFVFVDNPGCLFDQTGPFLLAVIGLPQGEVVFAGDDSAVCDNSLQLNATPVTTGIGRWTAPPGVFLQDAGQASTLVTGLKPGENRFVWTVSTDECGVIGADTLIVVVATGLQAADDHFILELANTEIFMDVLKNEGLPPNTRYILRARTLPEFGTLETLPHGFRYYEEEGLRGTVSFVYEVCYADSDCATACDTATVTIEVLNLPYLPEGFSPNDDGVNDLLEVLGYRSGGDVTMRLAVTNRWGDLVYEAENYLAESPWDGRSGKNREPLPEGAYYALMEINVEGEVHRRTQVVYIIQ